jgi:cell division protein FtsQ
LPEGEEIAAEALVKFARIDGINRLLGRDLIYFDLRDPARAYLRKAPKAAESEPSEETKGQTGKANQKVKDSA